MTTAQELFNTAIVSYLHRSPSGHLWEVDAVTGKATRATCRWLIEIASGNPEPDSYEDTIKIVDCGAPLRALTADPEGAWACDAGHSHWPYGTPENEADQWAAERRAEIEERWILMSARNA